MNVVILNDKRAERETMIRVLQQASCTVEAFGETRAAMDRISRSAPQVLVLSWPNSRGADLVRTLRGADGSDQMYVLAILDPAPGGREIPQPLAAGVHDFIRRPIVEVELVSRVQAPVRLLKWAKSVTKPVAFDCTSALDITRLSVWKTMGEVVAADLAQMVGDNGPVRPGWPKAFARDLHGATIPMSLPSDQLQWRVSVVADRPVLQSLGAVLLGDSNAEQAAMNDVLRELANTAGGAVKRAALPEGIALTTGIPLNEAPLPTLGERTQSWMMPIDAGKSCIAIVGELRSLENQRVVASELCEGMVLVYDLRSDDGTLLVRAGARLTSTTAARLAQMLGPRFRVEVAPCVGPSH